VNDICAEMICYDAYGKKICEKNVEFMDETTFENFNLDEIKNSCVQLRLNIAQNFDDPLQSFEYIMQIIKMNFSRLKSIFLRVCAEPKEFLDALSSSRELFNSEKNLLSQLLRKIKSLDTFGIWFSNVNSLINDYRIHQKNSLLDFIARRGKIKKIVVFYDRKKDKMRAKQSRLMLKKILHNNELIRFQSTRWNKSLITTLKSKRLKLHAVH